MIKIQIRVQNGLVREVRGLPEDYMVEVPNYDIDGHELHELGEEDSHRMCRISEWKTEHSS